MKHIADFSKIFASIITFIIFFAFSFNAFGQTEKERTLKVKFDLVKPFYYYRSLEFTMEKKISERLGGVIDLNIYTHLTTSKNSRKLSSLKTKQKSFGNFRLSTGINYYSKDKIINYRLKVSYGLVNLIHRRYVCLESGEYQPYAICECTEFTEDILDRKMIQMMVRTGISLNIPLSNNFIFNLYFDVGLVKYVTKDTGQIRDDVLCYGTIEKKYLTHNKWNVNFSDGAIKLDQSSPTFLFQQGLKLAYEF